MSYEAAMAAAIGAGRKEEENPYASIMASIAPASEAAPQQQGKGASRRSEVIDGGNAVGTGFFRGMTRLAGLPVDTVANVIDLGKAAAGSGYIAATGKAPPAWLEVGNRADVVGSGDNLVRNVGKTGAGNFLINPENPEYEGGYLQSAGAGLNAIINPQSRAQAVNQGVLGVAGALGARLGAETGDPAWAVIGGMTPAGVQQAATAGAKYAVRGDEQGRKSMEQRVQDLKNAGIDNPTLGLASGNKVIGGAENILQNTPGAVGVMSRARDAAVSGLRSKAEETAALASNNRGTMEAGRAIEHGINTAFKDRFKATQGRLYDRLGEEVGSQFQTPVDNTRRTLATLNEDIPGAPSLSKFFKNGKILALEEALKADTSGAPESVMVYQQPPRAGGGLMNAPIPQAPRQVVIPPGPQRNTLPFEAVKKTRSMVGNEIADSTIVSDVPRSKWNPLYGALSDDMRSAAQQAGGNAPQAFNRANNFSRAGMERLDRVAPFAEKGAPEQAFTAMERAARENVSTLQAVKRSLPEGARGQVAGTIIERLGKATNANQNDTSTAWSPETFLTNWNKMTPKAREELFSGFKNAPEVKSQVESVARATSMMRDSSKMWANPSGTGANLAARGLLGAVGVGGAGTLLGLVDPTLVGGVATGLLGANMTARALTSQGVREAMMRRNYVSPGLLGAQAIPMFSSGALGEQPN
jgi:hypothetical protein